ncbi:MAG: hypothetical protein CL555_12360 [Algoriphagus sp.]|nr:hypothetical protein [Algoriphagus sp.]
MKIEHIAIWVENLESMKNWYCHYLSLEAGELYFNPKKGFSSYFLKFPNGARLELMNRKDLESRAEGSKIHSGYAHIAISLGSKEKVDDKTQFFKSEGIPILDGPRTTGDGYYESVISDPEGNLLELTV